jgi:hypothetical protein
VLIPLEVEALASSQLGLIRRTEALRYLSEARLARLIGPAGRWRVVLPAIYATFTGSLTPQQRLKAALMYVADTAVVSGVAGCRAHGFRRLPDRDAIDVLLDHALRRQSHGFVVVERTLWCPEPALIDDDGIRYAPAPRCVMDACRRSRDLDEIRALMAEAVQRRWITIAQLQRELDAGPVAWSSRPRVALKEIGAGAQSVAECDLVGALRPSTVLPFVHYNCSLYGSEDGAFLGKPDGYVEEVALAAEVQSVEHHLYAQDQEADMERRTARGRYGVHTVEVRPSRLRRDPASFRADFEATYLARERVGARGMVRVECRPECGFYQRSAV